MKTPQQWLNGTDGLNSIGTSTEALDLIAAIQADARADLEEENRKMREILDTLQHLRPCKANCAGDDFLCPACRWESLKREMRI